MNRFKIKKKKMKREIKFRAWDKKNKRMLSVATMSSGAMMNENKEWEKGWEIVGGYVTEELLTTVGPHDAYVVNQSKYRIVDIHLMQYTGLKDINGKEIYEGDIVKEEHYVEPAEYVGDSYSRVDFKNNGWFLTWIGGLSGFYLSFDRCKVVGNVYENRRLSEKKS